MNRGMRIVLIAAVILAALGVGYLIGRRSTPEDAAPPPSVLETLETPETPASPPAPPSAPEPEAPRAPAPKAAEVVQQDEAVQVAEDAAAVGMTTVDPEPAPSGEDGQQSPPSEAAEPG